MRIKTVLQEGFRNLYHAKLRSMLALLGILVGSASVVAMVLGGTLATAEALREFQTLGTDLFAVSINSRTDNNATSTSQPSKSNRIAAIFNLHQTNKSIEIIAPYAQLFLPISFEGQQLDAMLLGVTGTFFEITKPSLRIGRLISMLDQYNTFCVIGIDLYQAIQEKTGKNPLGMPITIGKQVFIVAGILNAWPANSFIYANLDNAIMVPLNTALTMSKYASINHIVFRLTKEADLKKVEISIDNYLTGALPDKQFSYRSAKELINKMRKQNDILTLFLGLIGSVSLIVGGIGVMNIMLVCVIERKREIGLRLAIGATPKDITLLFLAEALALSLLGGTLGVILGIVIAYVIALYSHWTFTFFIYPPLVGFLVSVLTGIFFGFYPAYKASRLNPIEALRAD